VGHNRSAAAARTRSGKATLSCRTMAARSAFTLRPSTQFVAFNNSPILQQEVHR
jgi:hypothetical protein